MASGISVRAVYPGRVSWIDVAIAALVVIAGLRGWGVGLLRQLGSFFGRLIGLIAGCYLAVAVVSHVSAVAWRPLEAVLIVGVSTVAGGLIMRFFGGIFSARLHEAHLGLVDSLLGAGVGAAGTLLTCWLVAAVLSLVPWSVGQAVNKSIILRAVQHVLPSPPAIESRLQAMLGQLNVPSLFANVVGPTLAPVFHSALVTRHHLSSPRAVVTVQASGGCALSTAGSGFLVGPGEVMTVAHLVAGERTVTVARRAARVVLFDPKDDVAVLRTVVTGATPLRLASDVAHSTLATVVGYLSPTDRASTSAALSGAVSAPGRNIYSAGVFNRTMEVVVAPVGAGDDGAPVIVSGRVVAMIAQRSGIDPSILYAVPLGQLREALARVKSSPVSAQHCVS